MDRVDEQLSSPEPCRLPSVRCEVDRSEVSSAPSFTCPYAACSSRSSPCSLRRSDDANEIELLAFRHEVAMLRRQVKRQSFEPADRALFAHSADCSPLKSDEPSNASSEWDSAFATSRTTGSELCSTPANRTGECSARSLSDERRPHQNPKSPHNGWSTQRGQG
jgi:hypothetical protein